MLASSPGATDEIHLSRNRSTMQIRDATALDATDITEIHNDAVLHTMATWDETPVDTDNRAAWLAEHHATRFPVLVAIDGVNSEGESPSSVTRPSGRGGPGRAIAIRSSTRSTSAPTSVGTGSAPSS